MEKIEKHEEEVLERAINKEALNEALVRLITGCNLPYNAVEWPQLQALLMTANYTIEPLLIESHTTVPVLIDSSFVIYKDRLKQELLESVSLIHTQVDLWTSPNKKAFLAICARFVDRNYKLRKALLGLPQLRHSHGGELQARRVVEIIRDYGFAHKFGYITGDNASSNDNLCRHLSDALSEEFGVEWTLFTIEFAVTVMFVIYLAKASYLRIQRSQLTLLKRWQMTRKLILLFLRLLSSSLTSQRNLRRARRRIKKRRWRAGVRWVR
jgi:hypothetical protein